MLRSRSWQAIRARYGSPFSAGLSLAGMPMLHSRRGTTGLVIRCTYDHRAGLMEGCKALLFLQNGMGENVYGVAEGRAR